MCVSAEVKAQGQFLRPFVGKSQNLSIPICIKETSVTLQDRWWGPQKWDPEYPSPEADRILFSSRGPVYPHTGDFSASLQRQGGDGHLASSIQGEWQSPTPTPGKSPPLWTLETAPLHLFYWTENLPEKPVPREGSPALPGRVKLSGRSLSGYGTMRSLQPSHRTCCRPMGRYGAHAEEEVFPTLPTTNKSWLKFRK